MQIIITEQTKMWFQIDSVYLRTNEPYSMRFSTLEEARNYADWCENNGFRVDKLVLDLES